MHSQKLSVVIPAFNEEKNLGPTLEEVEEALKKEAIPYEIIVVNDNSTDNTVGVIEDFMKNDPDIRIVDRDPPAGFGRAVRSGLEEVGGDIVAVYMADQSDDPRDLVKCYKKAEEGYDCVFGTRFSRQSKVSGYPKMKLIMNRIVNKTIQFLFWTKHNDITNAFKVYRTHVTRECGPYKSSHFNITIEMSLSALIRGYAIASVPINWSGRTWGTSKLRMTEMGRRYLSVLLKLFFERILISDDLLADRLARQLRENSSQNELEHRVSKLEKAVLKMQNQPEDRGA